MSARNEYDANQALAETAGRGRKVKFTATFKDGTTVSRTSAHPYTVAWRATWTSDNGDTSPIFGFAVSRDKARPEKPRAHIYPEMTFAERAKEKRLHAEFMARNGYTVEFAEAVRS